MKRVAFAVATLAFAAGSANAAGCTYGKQQAAMASADHAVEESAVDEPAPRLLAQLRAQDAAAAVESETLVVPN